MSHAVDNRSASSATTGARNKKERPIPNPRSTVACGSCRLRKVRCSYSATGKPCTNCQYDGVACEIMPPRKYGAKRKHIWGRPDPSRPVEMEQCTSLSPWQDQLPTQQETGPQSPPLSPAHAAADSGTDFSIAFETQGSPHPGGNRDLLYFGDQQAINGMLLNLSTGTPQSSRCFVPLKLKQSHLPEDLEYLRMKGCFSIPSQRICDELITCYFQLVHPFVPVINATQFLQDIYEGTYLSTKLLVLWSMFSAASSFVDASIIQEAGYKTRKEMKLAMYRKAKHLFDSDFEEDKIAVLQSAIVLSFFYTDSDDRTGSWQWLGTAISLCQTLGLHRRLEKFAPENHFTSDKLRLFRRIWWTCFVRDRWLSLGQGRPMRMHLDFCDTPTPTVEDITLDLHGLPASIRQKYLLADQTALAKLWVDLVKLSKVLGNTIHTFYSFQKSLPTIEEVKKCDNEILQVDSSPVGFDADQTIAFHTYALQTFQGAATIVLYRPYLKQSVNQVAHIVEPSLRVLARTKVKSAALQINTALERLIDMDAVKWLQPISLTAIMPAMQIHLMEKSLGTSPLLRSVSSQKLQLCMMVLSEMRDNYWGAEAIYRLFRQAEAIMYNRPDQPHQDSSIADSANTGFDSRKPANPNNQASDATTLGSSQWQCAETQQISEEYWFDADNYFLDQSALDFLLDFDGPDAFGTATSLNGTLKVRTESNAQFSGNPQQTEVLWQAWKERGP